MRVWRARLPICAAAATAALWAGGAATGAGCKTGATATVIVVLDMDAATDGIQSTLHVPEGTTVVRDVAVYVYEPTLASCIFGIGYLGGIDRGIALGHMPDPAQNGTVTGFVAQVGTPIHRDNFNTIAQTPGLDPGFAGPEVQYIEGGAESVAVIPGAPEDPIFLVDVLLEDTITGDIFDFYLLDFVTVWTGGANGAFSTNGFLTLDSGGDVVPDGTQTIYGVDPDVPISVPPASFQVDYVDGPAGSGPATIVVVTPGDLDGDGDVDTGDLLALLGAWGPCPAGTTTCPADLDGDGSVSTGDLLILLANWGNG